MRSSSKYTLALSSLLCGVPDATPLFWAERNWNWDRFVHLASDSAVLPSLHVKLDSERFHDSVPLEIREFLSAVHALNLERNQIALAQFSEIALALNRVGIQPVALKGIANLLAGIYPDIGGRYLADIDLLVPEDQLALCASIIESLGYGTGAVPAIELSIGHTYPTLTRRDSLAVDLHRTTGLGICATFLPAAEVIAQSTVHDLGGAVVRLPSPEHLVTHHIMHCQMHDWYSNRITPPLRSMYDLLLLQRHFGATSNWPAIEERFCANRQADVLFLYLKSIEENMGIQSPISLPIKGITRLRWVRRRILARLPFLRFGDPIYLCKAGILRRTRRLREILAAPGGRDYIASKFFSREFYARVARDFS